MNNGLYTSYGVKDSNGKFTDVISIEAAMKVIEELITPTIEEVSVCEDCDDNPHMSDCMCHYSSYKTVVRKFNKCSVCGNTDIYPIDD